MVKYSLANQRPHARALSLRRPIVCNHDISRSHYPPQNGICTNVRDSQSCTGPFHWQPMRWYLQSIGRSSHWLRSWCSSDLLGNSFPQNCLSEKYSETTKSVPKSTNNYNNKMIENTFHLTLAGQFGHRFLNGQVPGCRRFGNFDATIWASGCLIAQSAKQNKRQIVSNYTIRGILIDWMS